MTDGGAFIQHKGSKLCADITCPACGEQSHWDDEFMYAIRCPACGVTLLLGDRLNVTVDDGGWTNPVRENAEEEGRIELARLLAETEEADRPG